MIRQEKTIVIADSFWEGHVPSYHKQYIKVLHHNYNVVSISPYPDEVKLWIESNIENKYSNITTIKLEMPVIQTKDMNQSRALVSYNMIEKVLNTGKRCKVPYMDGLLRMLHVLITWTVLNNILSTYIDKTKIKPDLVFFPYIDSKYLMFRGISSFLIDRIFHHPWSGLYMNPTDFRIQRTKGLIERIFPDYNIFKSKNVSAIATLDEGTITNMEKYFGKPIIEFPDITPATLPLSKSALVEEIEKFSDGKIKICLLGVLAKRKGILTLLETAKILNSRGGKYYFIIAGPLFIGKETTDVEKLLSENIENCYIHPTLIKSDDEFNELANVADILFASYINFYHSSGILTKASIFKKPIIVSDNYCMGERVREYRLGLTIPEGDVESCVSAIEHLAKMENFDGEKINPEYFAYSEIHSENTLECQLKNLVSYY